MMNPVAVSAEPAFYAAGSTSDPMQFRLPVARGLCVGPPERQFMMGGVGLASAIDALERVTERPLIWATAQFLAIAIPGATVELDVEPLVVGRSVTQARVTTREGDRNVLTVSAALGARDGQPAAQFATMPDVAEPAACPLKPVDYPECDDLQQRFEKRCAQQSDNDGTERLWFRNVDGAPVTAGLLAIVADFLAGALKTTRGSSSLDNSLRVHRLKQSQWLLAETRISGTASGTMHGDMRIFSEDGTLLATASQSAILPRR